MEEIAREADVAKGTIYLYYPSKQAIYDAAFRRAWSSSNSSRRRASRRLPDVQAAITAFVGTRSEYFRQRPDFFRMYIAEISARSAAAVTRRSACAAMLDRQTRVLERVLRGAAERGEIRDVDPAAAALAIFDITRGLVARHLLSRGRADATADVEFLTDLIWTGLRPARGKQNR